MKSHFCHGGSRGTPGLTQQDGSELALRFTLVRSVLQRPGGQNQLAEVHVAVVEALHTVHLVVDVVGHVLQVLQVGPL